MDINFEDIKMFLESISSDYNKEFEATLTGNDQGCIKSSVVLTEIISRRFDIPIGYENPGIRIKCGKVNETNHYWNEVSVGDKVFLDARFGQFNEQYIGRIRFEKIYDSFYSDHDFHGLTIYDDKGLAQFYSNLMRIDDSDTEFAYIALSPYPDNAKFMLTINDSGSTDFFLEQDDQSNLKRVSEMFTSY